MDRVGREIPDWIRGVIPSGGRWVTVKKIVREAGLHTVCTEARCPNRGDCLCRGTATFLILGDVCTRHCGYCAIKSGTVAAPDASEPERVASAVRALDLGHAVITSVTRDDLADGGAGAFCRTVRAIRVESPGTRIELLIPDFLWTVEGSLESVILSVPDVINHNIEVVRRLFHVLRPQGDYSRSLEVLKAVARSGVPAKSGLMIGFGETMDDIIETLDDLRAAGCSLLTVGQYLRSRRDGYPVARYWSPDEFAGIGRIAVEMGFSRVFSGPMVRSSFHAEEMIS